MKMDCTTTDVSQGTDTLEKRDKATAQDFLYQVLLFLYLAKRNAACVSLSLVCSAGKARLCVVSIKWKWGAVAK